MVNHPEHYISETGLEAIDVITAFTFDLKGIEAVCTGNALKYLCRWKQKNGVEDLKKAKWYIEYLIKHVENLEEENRALNEKYKGSNGVPGEFHFPHVFPNPEIAEDTLSAAKEVVDNFGSITLGEFYGYVEIVPNYSDTLYGWTSLDGSHIVSAGGGYMIVLPTYKKLKKESDK